MGKSLSILPMYFAWHYGRGLRAFREVAENYILFAIRLFSIPKLLETLIEPWKQIEIPPAGPLFSQEQLTAIWTNIISRTLGMIVRSCTIIIGAFFVLVVVIIVFAVVALWLVLPAVPPIALFFGLRLLAL